MAKAKTVPAVQVAAGRKQKQLQPPKRSRRAARAPEAEAEELEDSNVAARQREVAAAQRRAQALRGQKMLVENTTKSVRGVYPPLREGARGPETVPPQLRLVPGINKVDAELWSFLKDTQPMLEVAMREGLLVEREANSDLKGMSITDAKRLIGATFDEKLLTEWQKGDTRQQIQDALKRQFDTLKRQIRKRGYADTAAED